MRSPFVLSTLGALVTVLLVPAPALAAAPTVAPAPAPAAAAQGQPDARLVDLDVAWGVGAASIGARTTAPVSLPAGTMLVGADWGGAEAIVQVRSRSGGAWTPWTDVEFDPLEGPDPDSAEGGSTWSAPVLVGDADAVQFRTDGPALAAQGVIVEHGASPATTTAAATSSGDATVLGAPDSGATTVAAAAAPNAEPSIVTRAEWGADESRRDPRVPAYSPTVRFGVVHHTAGSNDYTAAQSAGIVRGIYEYHTGANGWWDIGYNFLVDKYGQVFEGRFGGVDRAVDGAHASGFNAGAVGIAVMGDFRNTALPPAARAGLEQLLAWKFSHHNVDPKAAVTEVAGAGARFAEGSSATFPRLVGHRHLGYTECPGSIYDLIDSGALASSVRSRMGPTIATDSPDRLESPIVGPATQVAATTTRAATWRLDVRDAAGRTVRTQTYSGREITASWDHQSGRGNWVRPGEYVMVLSATLDDGRPVPSITIPLSLGLRVPIVGDWDGDGTDDPGWWREGYWFLHDGAGGVTKVKYGRANDVPIAGDWDGDGRDDIGIVRGREWHLRLSQSSGSADVYFIYGRPADLPIVGNWDGDGDDDIGIVRDREWHLRNSLAGGIADTTFTYGRMTTGDIPLVGDWNGNGRDTAGVIRGDTWYLKDQPSSGPADTTFNFGRVSASDLPVVGWWTDRLGIGVIRGARWLLRDQFSAGGSTLAWDVPVP